MREAFVEKKFKVETLKLIDTANRIIQQYRAQGFTLTVRQLYYQFVARDIIANKQTEYKRLASIINDGRMAGLIDWTAIEDRTRFLRAIPHYHDPSQFLAKMVNRYAENLWDDQDTYCEVWIEKDALVGVIENVCSELRVPYYACRGYSSQSEQYVAGKRLARQIEMGKQVTIFHLGDHDPSGMHMSEDNQERLSLFAGHDIDLKRIALNMAQITQYNPPPNPAKDTDARFAGYQRRFGDDSWELDALDPSVIEQIVRDAINGVRDVTTWNVSERHEQDNTDKIAKAAEYWTGVEDYLDGL